MSEQEVQIGGHAGGIVFLDSGRMAKGIKMNLIHFQFLSRSR